MGKKLGMACKLYYSAALLDGDTVTPQNATWQELGNVSDSTLNRARGEADVTGRSNNGRKATLTTLLDESVDFDIWSDSDDEGLDAVETAFNDNTLLAMAVMDSRCSRRPAGRAGASCMSTSRAFSGHAIGSMVSKPEKNG